MSYVDAQQLHLQQIMGSDFGETVDYRSWTGPGPVDFRQSDVPALVDRQPRTPLGELLVNTIRLTVSKASLAVIHEKKDRVWVDGQEHLVHRYESVLESWDLWAVQ